MAESETEDLEKFLSNIKFIDGMINTLSMKEALYAMHTQLQKEEGFAFDGVRINREANRKFVMGSFNMRYTKECSA